MAFPYYRYSPKNPHLSNPKNSTPGGWISPHPIVCFSAPRRSTFWTKSFSGKIRTSTEFHTYIYNICIYYIIYDMIYYIILYYIILYYIILYYIILYSIYIASITYTVFQVFHPSSPSLFFTKHHRKEDSKFQLPFPTNLPVKPQWPGKEEKALNLW